MSLFNKRSTKTPDIRTVYKLCIFICIFIITTIILNSLISTRKDEIHGVEEETAEIPFTLGFNINYDNAINIYDNLFTYISNYQNKCEKLNKYLQIISKDLHDFLIESLENESINTRTISVILQNLIITQNNCYAKVYDDMGALSTNIEMVLKDLIDNRKNLGKDTVNYLKQFDKDLENTLRQPACSSIINLQHGVLYTHVLEEVDKITKEDVKEKVKNKLQYEINKLKKQWNEILKYKDKYNENKRNAFEILRILTSSIPEI